MTLKRSKQLLKEKTSHRPRCIVRFKCTKKPQRKRHAASADGNCVDLGAAVAQLVERVAQ